MLIHNYDHQTGQYLSSNLADADPQQDGRWLIPSFATDTPLPEHPPMTWPFWQGDKWVLVPDYRGRTLYRIDNGEPSEILQAGVTPEESGLTNKQRPSDAHKWSNGDWVIDPEIVAQQKRAAAMAEFASKMTKARAANLGKSDAIAAGLLNDIETALFKAWAAYQMALVRTIEASNFPDNFEWPSEPDVRVITKQVEEDQATFSSEQTASN